MEHQLVRTDHRTTLTQHSDSHHLLPVTLDGQFAALRSTRNHPRRAVRRGAAWLPAKQPSSCPVRWAISRAGRWPHRRVVWLPSAACAAHGNTVRRPAGGRLVVVAQMSGCLPCLGHPVRILGQRPRVRCLVSGVRVQCPRVRCPRVRCPMSRGFQVSIVRGVRRRCPRVPRPRPRPLCPHR